jgi:hypothetical protein
MFKKIAFVALSIEILLFLAIYLFPLKIGPDPNSISCLEACAAQKPLHEVIFMPLLVLMIITAAILFLINRLEK